MIRKLLLPLLSLPVLDLPRFTAISLLTSPLLSRPDLYDSHLLFYKIYFFLSIFSIFVVASLRLIPLRSIPFSPITIFSYTYLILSRVFPIFPSLPTSSTPYPSTIFAVLPFLLNFIGKNIMEPKIIKAIVAGSGR